MLVSKQGAVKVMDFGIAKAATQAHMTVAGETKGTPSMMAPEQRVGEIVDVRADVYSVAAVGYEILTNHGVNLDLAALAHLGVENWPHLPLPSSLRAELPRELDELLLGAMAFEREKRPADCAAFEAQFETVMKKPRPGGDRQGASGDGSRPRPRRCRRRAGRRIWAPTRTSKRVRLGTCSAARRHCWKRSAVTR